MLARVIKKATAKVTAVIPIHGVIATNAAKGVSHMKVEPLLTKAFEHPKCNSVILHIDSPGGSPAECSLIVKRVKQLQQEHQKPVYAVVSQVAASGGYYIACAADSIYVDDNSIVGSIGVISRSFGMVDLIEKIGIENRVIYRGDKKNFADPFQPQKQEDVERIRHIQAHIHDIFQNVVKQSRGSRLNYPEEQLFSGDVFVGQESIDAGLADGISTVHQLIEEKHKGNRIKILKASPWASMFGGSGVSSLTQAQQWLSEIERRSIMSTYGL